MKILYTAFKGTNNASYQLINLINPKEKIFLTNSFVGIEKDLLNIHLEAYDYIIMFGINKNLKDKLVIEVNALHNNTIIKTDIDYNKLYLLISESGIDVEINYNPTRYLCNHAYYSVLSQNRKAIFIHMPGTSKISDFNKIACLFS